MSKFYNDIDPQETQEWLDALDAITQAEGHERAEFIIERLQKRMQKYTGKAFFSANTPYLNTIPKELEPDMPGNAELERKIKSLIRWNAMAMVVKANKTLSELGGHIASFASSATLYQVGFNHFWHAPSENHGGDLIFFQGHSAPGMYARAYLEHRLDADDLHKFRQECGGDGLSSYPHPWLMKDFWQFPTVSMGLGPIMAIYQARFMKYLQHRGLIAEQNRKVWCFIGDGETDEPETLGAISLASREKLDNLIFVINCNLQRLDGPVRGNGKIIQELEANFRGNGWNVIKVLWGSVWDDFLAKDSNGLLKKRMEEVVDGDYQAYKAKGGAYVRENFWGAYPELKERVAHLSDDDLFKMRRGGHDSQKVYAAFDAAVKTEGQPTVILAKTVKGYGMGEAGEGQNTTHSQKKMGHDALVQFRDRFDIPISDEEIDDAPFYRPDKDSEEFKYLQGQRAVLGGPLPVRRHAPKPLQIPGLDSFKALLESSGEREMSTTMAIVRIMSTLARDKNIGKRIVPIVPDEARTFGMEGMFRQMGIYAPFGQLYQPEDADQLMWYKEQKNGQILEEGINEAGAMSEWIAAATAYSNHDIQMIPFYIYYSMFGFQRVGDLAWAAGDMQAKGFLIGGTAGRTTLAGEGLQHQDGHSHIQAHTIPNCLAYDPTFAYELAVIVQDGMRRMYVENESIFYYITAMNENYTHPAMPEGDDVADNILKGMYLFKEAGKGGVTVQLMGSGTILREVIKAADILESEYNVACDIWSAPGINELRRDGENCDRWNMLHPGEARQVPHIEQCLDGYEGPVICATDYIKLHADSVRPYVSRQFVALGTDGFGRSDTRAALREHFEVSAKWVVVAALRALQEEGKMDAKTVTSAFEKYGINPDKPNPVQL
ncbi:MAG: pyruvate dehydrogenase (acetyl-transferring), homodimeric type [Gammaproteobacteria bacterium]|nr:MAG: pyruvate dehydrogenase (acetyl-transferring), homodimeric type [Gammaproteobacteria bacterium]